MKWGELKTLLKDVPDDADLLVDEGELEFAEITLRWILPPVLEHPYAVTFDVDHVCNIELDMDARVDARLDFGGESYDVNT